MNHQPSFRNLKINITQPQKIGMTNNNKNVHIIELNNDTTTYKNIVYSFKSSCSVIATYVLHHV